MGVINRDKIAYGFMLRYEICKKYQLELDEATKSYFNTFYEKSMEKDVKNDVVNFMKEIPRKRPKKFIDKRIVGGNVDFILTYNKTMTINKCSRYAPINKYGQMGIDSFNSKFADILLKKVNTLEDVKKLYSNKEFLARAIPRWVEAFLECDYNVYLIANKIKVIKKMDCNVVLDSNKISISTSVKYPKISYDGISIIEIAYPRSTPNIRFNVANVEKFIEKSQIVDETKVRGRLGNATEKAICKVFEIETDICCVDEQMVHRIMPYIKNVFAIHNFKPTKYVGNVKGEKKILSIANDYDMDISFVNAISGFGNKMSSPIDFFSDERRSISVKTTKSTNGLVCPDTIGQPSAKICAIIMKRFIPEFEGEISPNRFIEIIMESQYLSIMLKKYVEYLFLCDYTLYLDERKGMVRECRLISRDEAKTLINYEWKKDKIIYEKSKEELMEKVNNTSHGHATQAINYENYRIGQFDIHKHHGRYLYQFRFKLRELLSLFSV